MPSLLCFLSIVIDPPFVSMARLIGRSAIPCLPLPLFFILARQCYDVIIYTCLCIYLDSTPTIQILFSCSTGSNTTWRPISTRISSPIKWPTGSRIHWAEFVLMQGRNGRHLLLAGQQKGVAAAAVLIKRKEKRADSIVCAERKVLVIGNSPKIHIYTHSIRSLVDHHIGPSSSSPVS